MGTVQCIFFQRRSSHQKGFYRSLLANQIMMIIMESQALV
jgi:hypothetical protein